MKRYFSVLMILIIVFICAPMTIAETGETIVSPADAPEISFVKMFDLYEEDEKGNFDSAKEITRAEMAEIIYKTARLSAAAEAKGIHDIGEFTAYERFIDSTVEKGILTLDYDGSFYPWRVVKVSEAGKIIATMLGYSKKAVAIGGFSSGYVSVAQSLGLFRGVNKGYNENLTYGDFALMLYNAQDIEILEPTVITEEAVSFQKSGRTFLNEVMGYNKIKGQVSDNGITSLTGESNVREGCVKINGVTVKTKPENSHIENYIAKNVIAYSTYTNSDTETLVGFFEDGESLIFDIDDFKKLERTSITFNIDEKDITKRIVNTPVVIYNGKAVQSFDESNFDYDSGTVTLISTDDSNIYDVIIIEGYISWYISAFDAEKRIYTDKTRHETTIDGEKLDYIDLDDENNIVKIYNHYGLASDIEHIYTMNLVDICKNGNFIKIIIAPNAKFDVVVSEVRDNNIIVADEKEYEVSEKFLNLGNSIPSPGSMCNIYVNSFGKAVRIETATSLSEKNVGYLIESAPAEGLDGARLHILIEEGKNYTFETANKVRLIKGDGNENSLSENELYTHIRGYAGIILYKLNDKGEVKELEFPAEAGANREDGKFGCIYSGTGYYETGRNNVDGKFALDPTGTKVFAINLNAESDEKKYTVTTMNDFTGNSEIVKKAYNFEVDSLYADYVTIVTEKTINYWVSTEWLMVTKISRAIDEDGNPSVKVTTQSLSGTAPEKILFGEEEVFKNVSDAMGTENTYDIKVGDIIRCATSLGKVRRVELLYRSDMENVTDPAGKKGNFVGTIGYFDSNKPGVSNPFILGSPTFNASAYTAVGRTILGYAYNIDSKGFLTYTTRDLSYMPYSTAVDDRYFTETISLSTNVVLVTYSGDEVNVKQGTKYDILTYKNVGENCSKIIRQTEYGTPLKFIVINGEIGE